MANHKSAVKRISVSKKRKEVNKIATSKLKTLFKKALAAEDIKEAESAYKSAVSFIDKMTTKGRIHKNNAARKKSRLTKYLNSFPATA